VLREAVVEPGFPDHLRSRAESLIPRLVGLGRKEHILLSYGDEGKLITPWELVTEERARHHLALAEETTTLAQSCLEALFRASS
jgi:hypothetical protein